MTSHDLPDGVSPWRIRVTVEAEPGSDGEASIGDTTFIRKDTHTTKIPLRGGSDDEAEVDGGYRNTIDIGMGRRRGEAVMTSPAKGRRRSSTPAKAQGGRRRKSLTDLNATVLGDDSDDASAMPRRRKSKAKKSPKKRKDAGEPEAMIENVDVPIKDVRLEHSRPQMNLTEADRSESAVGAFQIAEDPDAAEDLGIANESEVEDSPNLRRLDPNRVSIRRKGSQPALRKAPEEEVEDKEEGESAWIHNLEHAEGGMEGIDLRPHATYPSPPSSSPHRQAAIINESQTQDPTDVHEEFDSILESEGFTMISLESIPSARQFVSSPVEPPHREVHSVYSPTEFGRPTTSRDVCSRLDQESSPMSAISRKFPRSKVSVNHEKSDISSTIPSSPPQQMATTAVKYPTLRLGNTPEASHSSPRLPSPPRVSLRPPPINVEEKPTPPRLAGVMNAGRALQGALSPNQTGRSSGFLSPSPSQRDSSRSTSPKPRMNGLFAGHDSGTRKEPPRLLRLGQELGKTQIRTLSPAVPATRVRSTSPRQPSTPVRETIQMPGPDTLMARRDREKERQWQLEREAVSREIRMANQSQVIVVDSDDEDQTQAVSSSQGTALLSHGELSHNDEDDDDEDIWLEEAHHSSQQIHSSPPFLEEKNPSYQPRRRTLPSPWKRGEEIDQSTYLSEADMSGFHWRRPQGRSSSLQIPKQKSPNRTYDLAKLLGVRSSPQKIDLSPRKDLQARTTHECQEEDDDGSPVQIPEQQSPQKTFDLAEVLGSRNSPQKITFTPKKCQGGEVFEKTDQGEEQCKDLYPNTSRDESVDGNDPQNNDVSTSASHGLPHDSMSFEYEHETVDQEPEIGDGCRDTPEGFTQDDLQTELDSTEASTSFVPVVRVPVNFGDESSLAGEGYTHTSTSRALCEDDSRHHSGLTSANASILPQSFATTQAGWMGRLGSVATAWSKTTDESTIYPTVHEDSDFKPANTISISSKDLPESSLSNTRHRGGALSDKTNTSTTASNSKSRKPPSAKPKSGSESSTTSTSQQSLASLPSSGPWTQSHYRALHRLHLKSHQRAVRSLPPKIAFSDLRPSVRRLLGKTAMSGTGSHEVQVSMGEAELCVVEEFLRSFEGEVEVVNGEGNRKAIKGGCVWSGREVAMRLYSIVVGEREREAAGKA